jgi:protein SCO1
MLIAWVFGVVATLALVIFLHVTRSTQLPSAATIGGPFSLVDHRGKLVSERDYLGKPSLVFFGFTFCPDVCPTTLFELSNLLKEMGPDADRLNVLFITVDPDRDTPKQLAQYLSSFDPHITGLSGSSKNIETVMREYRAFARRVPLAAGGYTMDHTATVYMINRKGSFFGTINYQEPEETARAKLRRLLDNAADG